MEFYKAGKSTKSGTRIIQVPAQLTADLERTKAESGLPRASRSRATRRKWQEVRNRYDADKKRWVDLKQLHREGKLDLRDPKEIEASKKVDPAKQPRAEIQPLPGAGQLRPRRPARSPTTRLRQPSFCFRIAFACAGLALPWEAFITWPTSALKAFSLPAR